MTVRVVTDSSCCLSPAQLAAHGVRQVALHLSIDGDEIPEDHDGLGEDWLSRPGLSTSAANEEELAALYGQALEESAGAGVVGVHLSGGLSATAASAARRFDGAALAIRPVLRVSDGTIQVVERTRTCSRALDKLAELVRTRVGDGEAVVAVRHQQAEERAASVAAALTGELRLAEEIDVGPVDRVLAAHLGTGAVVLSALCAAPV